MKTSYVTVRPLMDGKTIETKVTGNIQNSQQLEVLGREAGIQSKQGWGNESRTIGSEVGPLRISRRVVTTTQ